MNLSLVTEAKKATHWIAAGVTAVAVWSLTPSGQEVTNAVAHAFPKAGRAIAALALLVGLYRRS